MQNRQILYETPVISTKKTDIDNVYQDPNRQKYLAENDATFNKMMTFMSKLQMKGQSQIQDKEKKVFNQIKTFLGLMQTTKEQLVQENDIAEKNGQEYPVTLLEISNLTSKIKQMGLVVNDLDRDLLIAEQKQQAQIEADAQKKNSQNFNLDDRIEKQQDQYDKQQKKEVEREQQYQQLKSDKDLQKDVDDHKKDFQEKLDQLSKPQDSPESIIVKKSEEDEFIKEKQLEQDTKNKIDSIIDNIIGDGLNDVQANKKEILDEPQPTASDYTNYRQEKVSEVLDDLDDFRPSGPYAPSLESILQETNAEPEGGQELIKILMDRLRVFSADDFDFQQTMNYAQKFINKQDYQTAYKIINDDE